MTYISIIYNRIDIIEDENSSRGMGIKYMRYIFEVKIVSVQILVRVI